jgi:multidrug transporter EmrE-like cation transporter
LYYKLNLDKFLFLAISILSTAAAQVLIKRGTLQTGGFVFSKFLETFPKVIFNPFIFLGLTVLGIGFLFWVQALSKLDLSLAYPAVASAYVIVTILSAVIFSEVISPLRWLSLGIIVLGVILLSQS